MTRVVHMILCRYRQQGYNRVIVKPSFSIWVIVGAVITAGILMGLAWLGLSLLPSQPVGAQAESQVALTVIPAATSTPPGMNNLFFTPTPTLDPLAGGSGTGIRQGIYVQITGTDGEGLRIRTAPGTGSQVKFLALDAEVFKVIEGPQQADDYTWWYLEAPYDQSRNGWAAAEFLTIVDVSE